MLVVVVAKVMAAATSWGTSCNKPRPSLDGAGGKRRSIVEINVQLYEEEILKRQNSFKNLSPSNIPYNNNSEEKEELAVEHI